MDVDAGIGVGVDGAVSVEIGIDGGVDVDVRVFCCVVVLLLYHDALCRLV